MTDAQFRQMASRVDADFVGLSPRVRGNHPDFPVPAGVPGPIPARAGQPGVDYLRRGGARAYPRACGATSMSAHMMALGQGLSPRVRGNLR